LLSALSQTNWNKSQAAERLHWSRMTLYRKMAKHHIQESTPEQPQRSLAARNSRNKLGADVTKV
jgi:hypothetical protein